MSSVRRSWLLSASERTLIVADQWDHDIIELTTLSVIAVSSHAINFFEIAFNARVNMFNRALTRNYPLLMHIILSGYIV